MKESIITVFIVSTVIIPTATPFSLSEAPEALRSFCQRRWTRSIPDDNGLTVERRTEQSEGVPSENPAGESLSGISMPLPYDVWMGD